jgi:sugar phosphate isomerase/epimerase
VRFAPKPVYDCVMARKIGVQLYTVREALKHDFKDTVRKIAAMGYQGVEMAGDFGGMTAGELRGFLDDLGLRVIGGHIGMNTLTEGKWEATLEDYKTLGASYLGVAGVGPDLRTEAGVAHMCEHFNTAGALSQKYGITKIYHNHDFEFKTRLASGTMYDALLAGTDPKTVKFEVDSYWVTYAGHDVQALLGRMKNRAPLIHIKDMTRDDRRFFEIVGEGSMDFDAVLSAGDAAGADWYIVEQDQCPKGELESVAASMHNIKARGWVR